MMFPFGGAPEVKSLPDKRKEEEEAQAQSFVKQQARRRELVTIRLALLIFALLSCGAVMVVFRQDSSDQENVSPKEA